MIYFDQAATTRPKPKEVIDAVVEALEAPGNPSRGSHEASEETLQRVFETRVTLQRFFEASDPRRVIFTSGATEALNLLILGTLEEGDHVITTVSEHNSVLRPLYALEEKGVTLSFCGLKDHHVDVSTMDSFITEKTKAIIISHASNVTGFVVDLYKVREICEKYNLLLFVDASQSAGEIPISMKDMGIDALVVTGHKSLFGPQGIGALLLSERVDPKPLKLGGSGSGSHLKEMPEYYPTKLEAGTLNLPGIYGLKAGIDVIKTITLEKIREKKQYLIKHLIKGIESIPGVFMYYDEQGVGILSFYIKGVDMARFCDDLSYHDQICSRSGAHCAPLMHEALKTGDEGLLRLSVSYFNSKEEADLVVKAIRRIAKEYIEGEENGR